MTVTSISFKLNSVFAISQKKLKEGNMKELGNLVQILPYLLPLIVLEAVLLTVVLVDLSRRQHVTGGHKVIWVLVAVCVHIIGPVIYLIAGRKEDSVDSY
jgi:hypothetical protein